MKKLVTIFALFTLVMLTSFVEPNEVGGRKDLNTGNYTDVGGRKDLNTGNYTDVGGRKDLNTGN